MGKLHRDNAGYVGCSYEDTQDPFWSYNKLALALSQGETVDGSNGGLPVYNTTDAFGTTKGSGTRADAFSSSIALAIAMDGANNGTTFTDESATIKGGGSAKSITRNGDTKTSTAQSKFYGSSGYFDGSGDNLTIASNSDFDLGTGLFTIEFWVNATSFSVFSAFINRHNYSANTGWGIWAGSDGKLSFWTNASAGTQIGGTRACQVNTWHHFAVVRDSSNVVTLYLDGVSNGSATIASFTDSTTSLCIGDSGSWNSNYPIAGYLQDVRIYKGAAKYTSDFIVPESGPSTFDRSPSRKAVSNVGATWQTSVSKFYGGATAFLGGTNSSNLALSSSTDFVLDGDFTIETWLYLSGAYNNSYRGIFQASTQETGGISTVYHLSITSTSQVSLGVHASTATTSAAVVTSGVWHHIAVVRQGGTLFYWVNGSSAGSASETRTLTNNGNAVMIGQICDGTSTKQPLNGYLQDFRMYKGIAKYTSSFTPPARSLVQTARRYPSGMHVLS